MGLQHLQGDDLQGGDLTGLQPDGRGHAVFVGLHPARGAHTPVVTGLEPWKAVGRGRSAEIIALGLAVGQETLADDAADRVPSEIGAIGATRSIAKPTSHRRAAAEDQGVTQDIEGGERRVAESCCHWDVAGKLLKV